MTIKHACLSVALLLGVSSGAFAQVSGNTGGLATQGIVNPLAGATSSFENIILGDNEKINVSGTFTFVKAGDWKLVLNIKPLKGKLVQRKGSQAIVDVSKNTATITHTNFGCCAHHSVTPSFALNLGGEREAVYRLALDVDAKTVEKFAEIPTDIEFTLEHADDVAEGNASVLSSQWVDVGDTIEVVLDLKRTSSN